MSHRNPPHPNPSSKHSLTSLLAPSTANGQSLFTNHPSQKPSQSRSINPQQFKNELVSEEDDLSSSSSLYSAASNTNFISQRENEYQSRWRKRIEDQGGMENILQKDGSREDVAASFAEESPHLRYQRQLLEQQRQKEISALKRKIDKMESSRSVQERNKKRRRGEIGVPERPIKKEVKTEERVGPPEGYPPQSRYYVPGYPIAPVVDPSGMPPPGYHHYQGVYSSHSQSHLSVRHSNAVAPPPAEPQQDEQLTDFVDYGLSGLLYKGGRAQEVKIFKWKPDEFIREAPPDARWRMYLMRGKQAQKNPVLLSRSFVFFGADSDTVDVQIPHEENDATIGEQHAVVCFRSKPGAAATDANGQQAIKPYIIDLESKGGTRVNGRRIESARYFELRHGDLVQFGESPIAFSLVDKDAAKLRRIR